jgi:signal transduction histidine kinase
MGHELRTPLNGILGYAQILARAPELSPRSREGVQIVKRSGEHLLSLLNDLLDLAKIEAGKMELVPRKFDLLALVRAVVDLCGVRAEQRGIAFTHAVRGAPVTALVADEKRLMQVLLNLLGNAIKFTERGGVRFAAQLDGRWVRVRVEDTGIGIADESRGRLFQPFSQLDVGLRRKHKGAGLGLFVSQRLAELLGGSIDFSSTVGEGSSFTVSIPA